MQVLRMSASTTAFTKQIIIMPDPSEVESGGSAEEIHVFSHITRISGRIPRGTGEFAQRMAFKTWNLQDKASDTDSGLDIEAHDFVFAGNTHDEAPKIFIALTMISSGFFCQIGKGI